MTYEIGELGDGQTSYDITIVYRDFVTGAPLEEASVRLDNTYIGETNDSGEILLKAVTSGIKHTIRATKVGYLNSASDSLANDTFMIREDN